MPQLLFSLVVLTILLACLVISVARSNIKYRRLLKVVSVVNTNRKPHEAERYVRIYAIRTVGMDGLQEEVFPMLFTHTEVIDATARARKQPEDAPVTLAS